MRYTLIFSFLFLLSAHAHAQSSGLLLGLRAGERSPLHSDTTGPLQYRTLWLAPADGKVALVAELPVLVVPRNNGFWQLDVERSCGITAETMEGAGPFVDSYSEPVWRKLGTPRTFRPGDDLMDCVEARRKVRDIRPDTVDAELYAEPCNIRDVVINYASPRYVSFETYSAQTEFCSPGLYTSRTVLSVVDTLHRTPSLLESLPPARMVAVKRKWEAARTDCTFEETPEENWGIIRGTGQWITNFASTGPTACRGDGMADFDIPERVPPSIARSEPVEWSQLLKDAAAPLDDYFVSPAGDLVAIRSRDQLSFYAASGRTLVGPLLRYMLRQDERVILAEWAIGPHAVRWSNELSRIPR